MMATVFVNPMEISFAALLWLILPLCAGVAIVYKAVRTQDIRRLGLETLVLMGYMVAGLTALAAGLWLIQAIWA